MTDGSHVATSYLQGPLPKRVEMRIQTGKEQEKAQAFELASGQSSDRISCHLYNATSNNPSR